MIAEEDPPEYNVTERIRQLNEELAQEDAPDDDRQRSIKFKDNLVDLVAPPPDYPSEDEEEGGLTEGDSRAGNTGRNDTNELSSSATNSDSPRSDKLIHGAKTDKSLHNKGANSPRGSFGPAGRHKENNSRTAAKSKGLTPMTNKKKQTGFQTYDSGRKNNSDKQQAKSEEKHDKDKSKPEKILVERDGTFELLDVNELTAEERQLYLAPAEDENDGPTAANTEPPSSSFQPFPPRDPRPATAGPPISRRTMNFPPRRAQSARLKVENQPILEGFNYTSPYALTAEQKKILREEKKNAEVKEKKQAQLAKMEAQEKNRENNEAFQAWLANKRKEISCKRKQSAEKQKEQKQAEEDKKKVLLNPIKFYIPGPDQGGPTHGDNQLKL